MKKLFLNSFLLAILLLLSACFAVGDAASLISNKDDISAPEVQVSGPSPSSGNSSSTFVFSISISNADTVNLTDSDILVSEAGTSCDSPVITNGTTANPTISFSNCTGDGTLSISIKAGVAKDASGNSSISSSTSSDATVVGLNCPSNYIKIPGNSSYGTSDFCVMKYEAKLLYDSDGDGDFSNATIVDDGNFFGSKNYDTDYDIIAERVKYKAVSAVPGRPWVMILRGINGATGTGQGAIEACQNLNNQEGTTNQYDLITNDEWQTIARNIEEQKSGSTNNWGTDSYGDLSLNHGHADNAPGQSCNATNEYVDGDCSNSGTETDFEEKRTNNLSNGEVIWDIGGNVMEWVKDNNSDHYGPGSYFSQVTAATHASTFSLSGGTTTIARNAKDQFGPVDNYTGSSTNFRAALGYGYLSLPGGVVIRGGNYMSYETVPGVFFTDLRYEPTENSNTLGFRCVFRSP